MSQIDRQGLGIPEYAVILDCYTSDQVILDVYCLCRVIHNINIVLLVLRFSDLLERRI